MQYGKAIISFCLIFTYSIGFAHNLVPTCDGLHLEHSAEHTDHHDEHHHHDLGEDIAPDHTHIAHQDHFDHGLLDLLICALEDVNHHEGSCDLDYYTEITEFAGVKKVADEPQASIDFIFSEFNIEYLESTSNFSDFADLIQSNTFLRLCPDRGPPNQS